jgi:type VI secretion system protein ImpL
MELLARLSRSLPLVLLVLGLLLLLLVVFLYLLVRSRRKRQEEEQELAAAQAAGPATPADDIVPVDFTGLDASLGLVASFSRGLRLLKRHVSGAGYRSQIPWFLFLGEEATEKHALLENAGMDLPRGVPEPGQGCAWWLFDRGVLLDIAPSFVLDATGRSSDEARFQQLLRLLKRHRAERPIDGIVLVLPGLGLARPGERASERTARAERKATILAGKIREAQTRLGLRLPIYLLVTGGETLPGFTEFFAELPERFRDEIFGWSSPYGVETVYRSEWVDEAFAGVRRDLLAAQLEVLAERRETAPGIDADALFSFPDEILAWKEPLRIYADRLFRPSAYHESIFPRGIYFCATDPVSQRSLFLKDLFERKVFPEHNLARPTAKTFGSQGRAVRILQVSTAVAALVLSVGLALAYRHLDANRRSLQSFLEKTLYSLNELRTIRLAQQKPTPKLLERQTFQLFEDMSQISTDRFASVFIPQSWFNPFTREIQRAIGVAYDHIIYRGFKYGLAARVDGLAGYRPVAEASEAPLPLEVNPRFRELRDYVDRAVDLEKNVDIYNSLKATQRLEDMGSLVKYLYDRNLSEDFYQEARLYRTALSYVQVQPFVFFDAKKEGAHYAVRDMASRLYQNLYRENPEVRSLAELTRGFEGVRGESAELSRLLQQMEQLEAQTARADLGPLAAPGFNLGPAYDQMLTRIGASALLGSAVATEAREEGRREQQAFRQGLATYGWSPYLEPYLVEKGNAFVFSPDLKLLYGALADFLRQSAAPEGRLEIDDRLPAGQRLLWDLPLLEQAVALYEPYKSFSEHGLAAFPGRLKEPLQAIAAQRVTAGITDLVVRAERVGPAAGTTDAQLEQDLRDQVDSLTAAAKPLGQIRDIYRRLGLPGNDQRLALLTSRQGYAILRGLDRLLADERLYAPRQGSFATWDGTKTLAARAFVSGDPSELPGYLDKQRERIAYLASEYAAPVLKAVSKNDARREQEFLRLYERWTEIEKGLKDYEAKKAGNSLASLEGLVLQDLEEVELANCSQKVLGAGSLGLGGSGDYFGCTAQHLRRDLLRRCYGLAVDGYTRIARLFDARLAGRYPFAETLPGRADAEADPDAIREFFALFDRYGPMLLAGPREAELGGGRVREFVVEMQAVRAFFAPFLDGEGKAKPPAYDVAVDFRVEKGDELDGNQVLRWQLGVGDRFARENAAEPERHLRWTLGTPVAVTLGWAKDSPFVPVDANGQELPEKAATFTYANRWSLLALAHDHPLTVREPGESPARTLEFVLPTKNPATGTAGKTRVFLRLTFRPVKAEGAKDAKDKEKEMTPELSLPRFPSRAPRPEPLPARLLAATREEAPCAP